MWIKVEDDYYNEDSIAFVRRLKKEKNGMSFVVNLKSGYDLSGHGKRTIFLPLLEGIKVVEQIEASIEERRNRLQILPIPPILYFIYDLASRRFSRMWQEVVASRTDY